MRAGVTVLTTVLVIGTVGFVVIESMSALDAFYMTAITISTVGFGEVGGSLSSAGKLFTVGVIIFGMGSALYTAAVGVERGLDRIIGGERWQRRMGRRIDNLSEHIILCGYGRVGSTAWRQLVDSGEDVVVIEVLQSLAGEAREAGALVIDGDATLTRCSPTQGSTVARPSSQRYETTRTIS